MHELGQGTFYHMLRVKIGTMGVAGKNILKFLGQPAL